MAPQSPGWAFPLDYKWNLKATSHLSMSFQLYFFKVWLPKYKCASYEALLFHFVNYSYVILNSVLATDMFMYIMIVSLLFK